MKIFITKIIIILILFSDGALALSQEKIRTLLKVGYLDNLSPLVFNNGELKPSGMAIDYLNQFGENKNFQFEYFHYKNKNELCDDLESGKISIAIGFTQIANVEYQLTLPYFGEPVFINCKTTNAREI
ncbi:transporter substrate-binding domain-containing protein [Yersinia pekkanenii]|uniref:Bacterial extracellular solute-binding proteins, family 3 n=1 Tax=Yersinia pekkanenii TaxID=1288385 RepID=A0A0T9NM49_9GAMM|nr:transporter substrate-binding domain-containing protein [Yersinia pekkanenii]CNH19392.1 Bacterial extracellular solute-binding proteins%2C family 3 [Yersinia pekkanenii]CRY66069.1 Bacterial extracellular solute-binding proteins%2C family 3 [Yersinia pekkanenii]